MKPIILVVGMLCVVASPLRGQSTMEFESGTSIEVGSGADICADNVVISGSYSGAGTQCGGALPVELASMTAVASKRSAVLQWTTATETDNFGFEIERRTIEGREQPSPWVSIAFVRGEGVSTASKEYSFTDDALSPGRYAYRLRQIDGNGSFRYTAAVEIEVGLAPKEFTLSQNYPNPFNPTTTVEFTLQEDGHVVMMLYDALGRQIETLLDEDRKAGYFQQITIDGSRLGSGVYFLRLEGGGRVLTRRITLIK